MIGKKKGERFHARQRLFERYGLKYSQNIRDKLRCSVVSGGAFFIKKQSNRVKIWESLYRVQRCDTDDESKVGMLVILRFAYDKERKEIITFLPRAEEPKGDEDVEDSLSNGFGDGQTGLRVPRGTQERQVERGRSPWDPGFEEVFHGEATGDPASKIVRREVPRQEDEGISGGGLNGETDLDRV